jgi:hypothetical protein
MSSVCSIIPGPGKSRLPGLVVLAKWPLLMVRFHGETISDDIQLNTLTTALVPAPDRWGFANSEPATLGGHHQLFFSFFKCFEIR